MVLRLRLTASLPFSPALGISVTNHNIRSVKTGDEIGKHSPPFRFALSSAALGSTYMSWCLEAP